MTLKKDTISARVDAGTRAKLDLIKLNTGLSTSKVLQVVLRDLDINAITEQNG